MLDEEYPDAKKVRLLLDNLKTHSLSSFYETFEPEEAHRLASRIELILTPKHGSWLNIAEIEFSALKGQCLNRRIPTIEKLQDELTAWERERNNTAKNISWQFTTKEARTKFKRLYPKL